MSKHTEHWKITVGSIVGSEAHHYATTIRKSPYGDHNLDEIVKHRCRRIRYIQDEEDHTGESTANWAAQGTTGVQREISEPAEPHPQLTELFKVQQASTEKYQSQKGCINMLIKRIFYMLTMFAIIPKHFVNGCYKSGHLCVPGMTQCCSLCFDGIYT